MVGRMLGVGMLLVCGVCSAQDGGNAVREFRACTAEVGIGVVLATSVARVDPYEQGPWPSTHRDKFNAAESCLKEKIKPAIAAAEKHGDLKEAIKQFYVEGQAYIDVAKNLRAGTAYPVVTRQARDKFTPAEQRLVLEMDLAGL